MNWKALAAYLAALSPEDRDRFSHYAALDLPEREEAVEETLRRYAAENPDATPSGLLATTGAHAGFAREMEFARSAGLAALELAETREELQLAHVCLAQTYFQTRRDAQSLEAFVEHCRAAMDLGHTGTFCYERLATLYEYRGDLKEAARVCRRAVEVLEDAGDASSAGKFRRRLERLAGKGAV